MPAMHVARMAKRFAEKVTIYTHGAEELTEVMKNSAKGTGILVDKRPISRLIKAPSGSEVDIVFDDSTRKTEGFLVSNESEYLTGGQNPLTVAVT